MLQISESAVALLEETREAEGVPESYGVRFFGESDPEGRLTVRLTFASEPNEGDAVLEEQGTSLYVAPEVVEPLQGKLIDVEEQAGQVALVIRPTGETG